MTANAIPKSEHPPVDANSSWNAEASLTPEDLGRVLYDWQLMRVRLYEVHVQRLEGGKPAQEPATKPVLHSDVRVSVSEEGLLGRLSLTLVFPNEEVPDYRIQLSLDGFCRPRDSSASPPSQDKVGHTRLGATILTLLWPYAREFAHDLMRRMEIPIHLLPTIDRLELETVTHEAARSADPTHDAVVE